jgi:hypothetical protein
MGRCLEALGGPNAERTRPYLLAAFVSEVVIAAKLEAYVKGIGQWERFKQEDAAGHLGK